MSVHHADDWWPDRETGILGHGHDGLVIDRIKHSKTAMRVSREDILLIALVTVHALAQELEDERIADTFSPPLELLP